MGASNGVGHYDGAFQEMITKISQGRGNLGGIADNAHWTGRAADNFREAGRSRQTDFNTLVDKLKAAEAAFKNLATYTG